LDLFGNIDTFNKKSFLSTSGIGVGLSSSYKLAKALGGNLELTSAKKVGTSVKIIIEAYSENKCEWNNNMRVGDYMSSLDSELDEENQEGNINNLLDKNGFNLKLAQQN